VSITGSPGNIIDCPYNATFGSSVTTGAPCGDITYDWSMTGPVGAASAISTFGGLTTATASFSFEVCGTYVIDLTVTDGCSSTANATSVTVTANCILTMAVDPTGGGTATDQTGSSSYAENTTVSISAVPATGYLFLYWTTPSGVYNANFGDIDDPSTTFTMPGVNTTVTARFLEFVQNDKTFSESCDTWTADQSASGVGITIDIWNITSVGDGQLIDFKFDAIGVPDRWFVYYNNVLVYETGWRGDSSYDGNPLYPGGVTSPAYGEQLAVVTKLNGVNTLEIRTEGAQAGTASHYNLQKECT